MFNRKANYTGYYQPKMSKTGNKYDVNNPSYSKTIFSGNKGNSNFGLNLNSYNNMNFGSTFGPKKDDLYNIDLNINSDKYKKDKEKDDLDKKNEDDKKKKKKKKGNFLDDMEDEIKNEKNSDEDDFDDIEIEKKKKEDKEGKEDKEKEEEEEKSEKSEKKEEIEIQKPKKKKKDFFEDLEENVNEEFGSSQGNESKKNEKSNIETNINITSSSKIINEKDEKNNISDIKNNKSKISNNSKKSKEEEEEENEDNNSQTSKPVEQPKDIFSGDAMEQYLQKKNKIDFSKAKKVEDEEKKENEDKNNNTNNNISNINSNINNKSNIDSPKSGKKFGASSDEDDYGGFDQVDSIGSSVHVQSEENKNKDEDTKKINTQESKPNITESIDISQRINNLIPDNTNSQILSSSGYKYENEFKEMENINEENNESNANSLIQKINEEHQRNQEELERKVKEKNNINNIGNSNINSNVNSNINSENNFNNLNSNSINTNILQQLIAQEVNKRFQDTQKIIAEQNNLNRNYNSSPGLNEAKKEFLGLKVNQNQLYYNPDIKYKSFNTDELNVYLTESMTINKLPKIKTPESIINLKTESALNEEQKRRHLAEYELNNLKKYNEELANHIKELEKLKYDNMQLRKDKMSAEKLIENMKRDFVDLKNQYDTKVKEIEDKINARDNMITEHKLTDLERRYQLDLSKKQFDLDELRTENSLLKAQNKQFEEENFKLKDNTEFKDKITELEKENYVLHEKYTQLEKEKESIEIENSKLKLKEVQNEKNVNNPNFSNQILLEKKDSLNIYEQLLNDRDVETQEKLLQSYQKEIEELNKEINFLKSIPSGNNNKIIRNNFILENNNTLTNQIPINDNLKNQKINPSLKESAEIQMRKLQKYVLPNAENPKNDKLQLIERQFKNLQNEDTQNEITFDNYMGVMKNMNVPLTSYELIEIFNNFPRIKGNRIKLNDFLSALTSKDPSTFYIQSDPSYLNQLEGKLIKSQNRVKELEKFILINANESDEYKNQIKNLEKENKGLKEKLNDLNSQLLKYFLYREEKNSANPDVIQMKEKMKTFEANNKTININLKKQFDEYEQKIGNIQKNFNENTQKLTQDKDKLKEKADNLEKEKFIMKNDFEKKENKYKNEIEDLNKKLDKYKKNYQSIVEKNENITKENERVLNCLKDKGFDPEKIKIFVESYDDFKLLLKKIEELEMKNLNREEIYKRICQNVNAQQLAKEIEKLSKKHEEEKRGLLKLLAQKTNEINEIKLEFNEIMLEVENLRNNGGRR